MAHPLHAEVVRAAMPATRARAILLAEAERLESVDPTAGPAPLRIAVWRLDGGGRPDPAVLVRGAHLATQAHDFRLVQRLLEAVPDDQLDALGTIMLGERSTSWARSRPRSGSWRAGNRCRRLRMSPSPWRSLEAGTRTGACASRRRRWRSTPGREPGPRPGRSWI